MVWLKKHKFVPAFLLVLMFLLSAPAAANYGNMASLTVECPYSGSLFELYPVALETAEGALKLTEPFLDCPVDKEGLLSAPDYSHAVTLESYVRLWDCPPVAEASVGTDGKVCFSGLDSGLYLLCCPGIRTGDVVYTVQPLLVRLPMTMENGETVYDVDVVPKVECVTMPGDDPFVSRKVLKVWIDEGREAFRPDSIRAHLLRDGEIHETIILSDDNNWSYIWTELDAGHLWTVAEDPVEEYTVELAQEGDTFVLTNTSTADPLPEGEDPMLPQTGLLWWPVPLLGFSGVLLVIFGLSVRRREKDEA